MCWSNQIFHILRVRMGPGNPGKPWKIFEALEIPGNPGNALEFFYEALDNLTELYWKNKFIKWCIFRAQQWASWSHWPFRPVTVKIYWSRFKEYWPGQKSKEANSNSDGCVSMGILPYWIWISMCMANVVLASWFPAGACLYWNLWSYYFRILNGFSFWKYFFQSYFPWQKCFNK